MYTFTLSSVPFLCVYVPPIFPVHEIYSLWGHDVGGEICLVIFI